jgi:predicted transcriptional regulator
MKAQRDILSWLRDCKKERGMSVSQLAYKLHTNEDKVIVELRILQENNLIECDLRPSGRIVRARINTQGENYFSQATKIVTKDSVKEQLAELKVRIDSLETALEEAQQNPTADNKKALMDNLNTYQSVANGVVTLIKAGWDLLK